MAYFLWILFCTIFGAIIGHYGFGEVLEGSFWGFFFGVLTAALTRGISGPPESLIDDIFD